MAHAYNIYLAYKNEQIYLTVNFFFFICSSLWLDNFEQTFKLVTSGSWSGYKYLGESILFRVAGASPLDVVDNDESCMCSSCCDYPNSDCWGELRTLTLEGVIEPKESQIIIICHRKMVTWYFQCYFQFNKIIFKFIQSLINSLV